MFVFHISRSDLCRNAVLFRNPHFSIFQSLGFEVTGFGNITGDSAIVVHCSLPDTQQRATVYGSSLLYNRSTADVYCNNKVPTVRKLLWLLWLSVFFASNCSVRVWLCCEHPVRQPSQFLNNTQWNHLCRGLQHEANSNSQWLHRAWHWLAQITATSSKLLSTLSSGYLIFHVKEMELLISNIIRNTNNVLHMR